MYEDKSVLMHKNMFDRMKSSIDQGFYLEGLFCAYAAIEGRLEVICGLLDCPCNKFIGKKIRKEIKISHRIACLTKLYKKHAVCLDNGCKLTNKEWNYLNSWIKKRNIYVHGLYKCADQYQTRMNEVKELAEEGERLAKLLYNEVKRLRRRRDANSCLFQYCGERCKSKSCILSDFIYEPGKTQGQGPSSSGLRPKVNVFNRKWIFHPYDDDPFPSIPHGHSEDNRFVLNVETGEVIERATGAIQGKATKKELKELKNAKGYREIEQKCMEYHRNKVAKIN